MLALPAIELRAKDEHGNEHMLRNQNGEDADEDAELEQVAGNDDRERSHAQLPEPET